MADLSDWTPENMADSVTEQATGPADELAKIDEFLVRVIKMFFIFCELASDAGESYSICMLLANLTIFNIPVEPHLRPQIFPSVKINRF